MENVLERPEGVISCLTCTLVHKISLDLQNISSKPHFMKITHLLSLLREQEVVWNTTGKMLRHQPKQLGSHKNSGCEHGKEAQTPEVFPKDNSCRNRINGGYKRYRYAALVKKSIARD